MPSPEPQRRGLRFSLRSLLFLVTFLAILLGTYKTLGRHGAIHIVDDLWPQYVTTHRGPDGEAYRSGHLYCPWLLSAGFYLSWRVLPLSAVGVSIYVTMSRRAPSFLLLFALGVIVVSVSFLLAVGANVARDSILFVYLRRFGLGNLVDLGPYYLVTMLTGSVLALVECRLKRLPWTAVWMSLAALVCSFLFFCFLNCLYRIGQF